MSPNLARLRRHSSWVPALLVFATVAVAGSRLIVLSVERRAEEARNAAQAAAARSANAIERQIDALAMSASSAARGTDLDVQGDSARSMQRGVA